MWMPRQMSSTHAKQLQELGVKIEAAALSDPLAAAARRGGLARRLHGVVRVARGAGRHQPPLRAGRAPAQLDPGGQPRRERLPREDARRRALGRPHAARHGRAGVHGRHREMRDGLDEINDPGARKDEVEKRQEAAGRRVREGSPGTALRRAQLLRRRGVAADREPRDPRRAPGLRPAPRDRQLRRRDRQLGVAAPHRRLLVLPRVRRQGRQAGRLLAGQRPVPPGHFLKVQPPGVADQTS